MTAPAGIRIAEAAARTGRTQWQLRGMARDGKLRSRKVGKFLLIHPDDVAALEAEFNGAWAGEAYRPAQAQGERT